MAIAAKKKPSDAQLAARKLFASRAKAGLLKKRGKAAPKTKPKSATKTIRRKNPLQPGVEKKGRIVQHFPFLVQTAPTEKAEKWRTPAGFLMLDEAKQYAHSLAKDFPGMWIRVVDCD